MSTEGTGTFWQDRRIELIAAVNAPLGLRGAINAGADAVVVNPLSAGFPGEARRFESMVSDAHLYGLKFYASVEQLLPQSKLMGAVRMLGRLFSIGVDGIYLRDVGLFRLAATAFKKMPLFAGPLMGLHNRQGVRWARDLGARRIALDPLLDLSRIGIIARSEKVPLEVYLHGAQCFGFPSLCRLTEAFGEEPPENGTCRCACRRPMRVLAREGEKVLDYSYVMGTGDRWMLEQLTPLARIGIAFGRIGSDADDPVYTAAVVGVYRKALEEIYDGNLRNYYEQSDLKRLRAVFNREAALRAASSGYLTAPRHLGNSLGTVEQPSPMRRRISIQLEDSLVVGDKIIVIGPEGRASKETSVRNIAVDGKDVPSAQPGDLAEVNFLGHSRAGDVVYKTVDSELVTQVKNSMLKSPPRRLVSISATLRAGRPLRVTVRAGDVEASAEGTARLERSRGKGIGTEQIARILTNMSGTPFRTETMRIKTQEPVDVPADEIPALKMRALEKLENKLRMGGRKKAAWKIPEALPIPSVVTLKTFNFFIKVENYAQACAALDAGAKAIYFPVVSPDFNKVQALALTKDVRLIAFAEAVLDDREVVATKRPFRKGNISSLLTGNFGLARWGLTHARIETHLDYTAGIHNTAAYYYWRALGAKLQTLGTHLLQGDLKRLVAPDTAVLIHGKLAVTFTRRPLELPKLDSAAILEDRNGNRLLLNRMENGLSVIRTAPPAGLFEEAFRLKKMGFQNFRLDFFDEAPDEVSETIETYHKILKARRQPSARPHPGFMREVYPR